MIYITALINETISGQRFEDVRGAAIQALLSGTTFIPPSLMNRNYRTNYQATITVLKPEDDVSRSVQVQVQQNQSITEIARLITAFDTLNILESDMYDRFFIPKASGGMREINAPTGALKNLHRDILRQLDYMQVHTHNAGFAYTKTRSIVDALKEHQRNASQWFLKIDLSNFFPSCTRALIKDTFTKVYPFNFIPDATQDDMIDIAMLNGGLPQGSPLSPLYSNLLMVPFDHALTGKLWDHNAQHSVYTRYADDLIISSKYDFSFAEILSIVTALLNEHAPGHTINASKTHYGSRAGRNWNLGLMLNKDNKITLGYRRKERIRASIHKLMLQAKDQTRTFSMLEAQHTIGLINYARQVEPEYWQQVITKLELKIGILLSETYKYAMDL